MEISAVKEWLGVIAIAISIGGFLYAWVTARAQKNSKAIVDLAVNLSGRIDIVDKKQVEYDRRIQRLEDDFKHLPDRDQITDIRVAIAEIGATVASTNKAIRRLEDDIRALKKGE